VASSSNHLIEQDSIWIWMKLESVFILDYWK